MALYRVFPLSQRAQILIIRRFHCACRFPARADMNFTLLTYHFIARATLLKTGRIAREITGTYRNVRNNELLNYISDCQFFF